jgi:hypothetical protein
VEVRFVGFEHGVELVFGELPVVGEIVIGARVGVDGGVVELIEEGDEAFARVHEGVVEVEADVEGAGGARRGKPVRGSEC